MWPKREKNTIIWENKDYPHLLYSTSCGTLIKYLHMLITCQVYATLYFIFSNKNFMFLNMYNMLIIG